MLTCTIIYYCVYQVLSPQTYSLSVSVRSSSPRDDTGKHVLSVSLALEDTSTIYETRFCRYLDTRSCPLDRTASLSL